MSNLLLDEIEELVELLDKRAHPGFARNVLHILRLHVSKGHDYGSTEDTFADIRESEDFGVQPSLGVAMVCAKKCRRLKSYYKKGSLKHEGALDSFLDLSNYALIGATMFLEEQASEDPAASPAA